jgi:hypothetical protein
MEVNFKNSDCMAIVCDSTNKHGHEMTFDLLKLKLDCAA